ncbi:peroxisome targeting signal receptor [Coprinopsis cinerea okayama7|uniref:Peroxisome targeting signal receptor n=1 Tax=Coprinopsis cinerea (strain Okayama-7 / 130 / ATCC MYA-4618 / FGSC 9003) TaxID=240176 RepID=A8N738_COPC7|nr:peroxisome targeting signal receptor [Coprinopsis cinerea okayama7\|eukprot:XP_001830644.2 peroxisome targeting signal receptor [Coprinopsis cinerea okayama7\
MSFQGLISGSECGASSNPLSQMLKHTEGDRSLTQDRIAGPSSSRLHQLPTSANAGPVNEHDAALARQFFESQGQEHVFSPGFMATHAPDLSRFEMEARPELREAWAKEQSLRGLDAPSAAAGWANEFSSAPAMNASAQQAVVSRPEMAQQRSFMPGYNTYGGSMGMAPGMYGMGMGMQYGMNPSVQTTFQDKGKGKSREEDFEAAFAKAAASFTPAEKTEDETVAELEDAMKQATLESKEGESDFKKVWDEMQNSDIAPPEEDLAKWESEFAQLMNAQREELDYGASMQEAWESGIGDFQQGASSDKALQFDPEGVPILGEYTFEQNNPFLESPSRSLLSDAKALLEQNGSLSEAALMIEAAIQKGELGEGGYEAWILLGETRNMDEREEAGMKALMEGVKRAEAAGAAGEGMLSLAISFTNESYDRGSHAMLLRWIRARHPELPIPEETIKAMTTNSAWDTHGRITDVFLSLARLQNSQGVLDPDVQIGLGVLFYNNSDYDRAKDCFEAALSVRPKDYLLWNRLGSSLSNGNKPEEALGAYREALQLRPTYTRAIYNVGVACLNIGADKEAAEHFLTALNLQDSTSNDTSDQLWFTLRRALLSMGRTDLADAAKPEAKTNLDVFRKAGFDF